MAEQEPQGEAPAFSIQLELSPAEASDVRESLLAALNTAEETKQSLTLDATGEQITPCALQLLVAATRSSKAAAVGLTLTESATKAIAGLHTE